MFSKKDIEILKGIKRDTVRELREEIDFKLAATESRLRTEIQRIRTEIQHIKTEIIEFIDSEILPQVGDLQYEIAGVKRYVKMP